MRFTDDRFPDNRFTRELRRHRLAARMLYHEARTNTISAWTAITPDQVRRLAQAARGDDSRSAPIRHRGQSPRQTHFFFRSTRVASQAAILGALFEHTGALPPQPTSIPSRTFPSVRRGEQMCEAFEAYLSLVTHPVISFEHAMLLLTSIACSKILALTTCEDCGALWVWDRYSDPKSFGVPQSFCTYCRPAAFPVETANTHKRTIQTHHLSGYPVQLQLFDPPWPDYRSQAREKPTALFGPSPVPAPAAGLPSSRLPAPNRLPAPKPRQPTALDRPQAPAPNRPQAPAPDQAADPASAGARTSGTDSDGSMKPPE